MCLLIVKPAGKTLQEADMEEGFKCNPHGSGFGWYDTEQETYFLNKGYFSFNSFIHSYRQFVRPEFPALVHFRVATHGYQNKENCHPHNVGGGWLMGHNGTFCDAKLIEHESDTVAFARDELEKWLVEKPSCLLDADIRKVLEERIGTGNKLAFLNRFGQWVIINEKAGNWHEGSWFSNYSWRRFVQHSTNSFHGSRSTETSTASKEEKKEPATTAAGNGGGSGQTVSGPSKAKNLDLSSDYAPLYEELIEISTAGGCHFCGEPLAKHKGFQFNQFTGECYCNDCIFGLKTALLVGDTSGAVVPEVSTEQEAAQRTGDMPESQYEAKPDSDAGTEKAAGTALVLVKPGEQQDSVSIDPEVAAMQETHSRDREVMEWIGQSGDKVIQGFAAKQTKIFHDENKEIWDHEEEVTEKWPEQWPQEHTSIP